LRSCHEGRVVGDHFCVSDVRPAEKFRFLPNSRRRQDRVDFNLPENSEASNSELSRAA
jgi:hypothetical protein